MLRWPVFVAPLVLALLGASHGPGNGSHSGNRSLVVEFPLGAVPQSIDQGHDGNMWLVVHGDALTSVIERMSLKGVITKVFPPGQLSITNVSQGGDFLWYAGVGTPSPRVARLMSVLRRIDADRFVSRPLAHREFARRAFAEFERSVAPHNANGFSCPANRSFLGRFQAPGVNFVEYKIPDHFDHLCIISPVAVYAGQHGHVWLRALADEDMCCGSGEVLLHYDQNGTLLSDPYAVIHDAIQDLKLGYDDSVWVIDIGGLLLTKVEPNDHVMQIVDADFSYSVAVSRDNVYVSSFSTNQSLLVQVDTSGVVKNKFVRPQYDYFSTVGADGIVYGPPIACCIPPPMLPVFKPATATFSQTPILFDTGHDIRAIINGADGNLWGLDYTTNSAITGDDIEVSSVR